MKLFEYQGKELFKKYGIQTPKSELISRETKSTSLKFPLVLKSQVLSGDRRKKGGVLFAKSKSDFETQKNRIFQTEIDGQFPKECLVEEKIEFEKELYVSFSYDTNTRMPTLSLSQKGGSGIKKASTFPIDTFWGLPDFLLRNIFLKAGFSQNAAIQNTVKSLWDLFHKERALLVEINPLFELKNGTYVAGDAKIILDDNVVNPSFRPYLDLPGDIAVLASGGGASLINLDALMKEGGRPANYVEYSGNPPASVVKELTIKVLSRKGLKGCWVVGGTANFTDIYETLLGFTQGLGTIKPKPKYPIVIRRDGPRQKEAFEMLREVAKKEKYDFHLYGPETPMSKSAKIMVKLAYAKP